MLPNFDWPGIVESQRRQLEFLALMADGGDITVNGKPWRALWYGLESIVSDPCAYPLPEDPFIRLPNGRIVPKRRSTRRRKAA